MDNTPRQDFHHNADGAPQAPGDDSASSVDSRVIVDEQGHPYGKTTNSSKKEKDTQDEILDRVKTGERWMIWLTAIVAGTSIFQTVQSCNNNKSTAAQVDRMIDAANRVGGSAESFSRSASGINGGVSDAVTKLQGQVDQSRRTANLAEKSVKDNQETAYTDLRPYVEIEKMDWVGDFLKGEQMKAKAYLLNSGKTPAFMSSGCADIAVLPNGQPMNDDYRCPNPMLSPTKGGEKENSKFTLIPGVHDFTVESPGTTMALAQGSDALKSLVLSGALRIYFYGYIEYTDVLRPTVMHHTTFCARYSLETGGLVICEKHNKMD